MITVFNNLLNSNSKDMTIDGSSNSQTFSFSPNIRSGVIGIMCVLKDDGATTFDKFGALTALTNGLLIQTTINGVTTEMATIKDNAELCTRFHFNQFGNGAILSILGIATPQGFGNSNNVFIGHMDFTYPNIITLSSGDSISVIVRDNLSNIDLLEMSVKTIVE